MEKINHTKTELHTHLMGMLSVKGFMELLLKNNIDKIYWPLDKPVDENTKYLKISEIIENGEYLKDFIKALMISKNNNVSYDNLNDFYKTRRDIIKYIIKEKEKVFINAKDKIYNQYINACLRELINQGIEYVEISYSIRQVLLNFKIDENIKKRIKCKFLLSTDRTNPISKIKESSKDLKKVLNNGVGVGFDLMGEENAFTYEELDYSDSTNSSRSIKRKLEIILDSFNGMEGTLRLHSGECKEAFHNTEIILTLLNQISHEKGLLIPPPEIRIGHGIYFDNNDHYLELLKRFKCIIEINASSNLALSNIKDYRDIPYKYYLSNDIPIVISTDGHGLYNTSIAVEDKIANAFVSKEDYRKIEHIDLSILNDKLGGKR